jgi:catalase
MIIIGAIYGRRSRWAPFRKWELGIQAFDQAFADAQPYDVLDATKLIPEEVIPVRLIGRMVLDRNPDNFFAETEQVAFCPANIVPGIDFSNDPLLQGRLFSYLDTQKSRLGTANFHQLPINAPKCPMMNFQRDGQMQMKVPQGRANYEPNSLAAHGEAGGPRECPVTGSGTAAGRAERDEQGDKLRIRPELFADHYSQARLYWRSLSENEQSHTASSFVFELSKVGLEQVQPRMVANLRNVDDGLAKRVADGLGIDLPAKVKAARDPIDMEPSPALSIQKNMKQTIEGRSVGILFANGSDSAEVQKLADAVRNAGGKPVLIAPKIGGAKLADGRC